MSSYLFEKFNNNKKRYRSRFEIIADILSTIKGETKKTYIKNKANLSQKLLNRYLHYIMKVELIYKNNDNSYEITDKGYMFLRCYNDFDRKRKDIEKLISILEKEKKTLKEILV